MGRMNNEEQIDTTFDVNEAAAYLKLARGYLYRLVSKGRISYSKPTGGKLLFRRRDLDAFIDRGRHPADFELNETAERIALEKGKTA